MAIGSPRRHVHRVGDLFLLSRGGDVPTWVILIGTLGGLLAHGLIGLFVGPIVMTLGYRPLQVWLEPEAHR